MSAILVLTDCFECTSHPWLLCAKTAHFYSVLNLVFFQSEWTQFEAWHSWRLSLDAPDFQANHLLTALF